MAKRLHLPNILLLLVFFTLFLTGCSSTELRKQKILDAGSDFGPAPSSKYYEHAIEEHIKKNMDVPLPEYFNLKYSDPLKLYEFNTNAEIIFMGWVVEVIIPVKSLTTFHGMIDDSDTRTIYVKFAQGKIISSSITEATFYFNYKETYAETKYIQGKILDADNNLVKARNYGAMLDKAQNFKYFRNIDYGKSAKNNEVISDSADTIKTEEKSDYSDLIELKKLYEQGVINQEEFTAAKKKILGI
jgi:hypothetical protein